MDNETLVEESDPIMDQVRYIHTVVTEGLDVDGDPTVALLDAANELEELMVLLLEEKENG